jgi:hypothetical protein
MANLTLLKQNIEGEKSAWIATFCMLLLWWLALLLSSALGGSFFRHRTNTVTQGTATSPSNTEIVKHKFDLERAARLIFLGLFSSVVINEILYGATKAVAVLAWIAFAVAAVYLVLRTILHRRAVGSSGMLHRLVDIVFLGTLAGLFTAMWSIAFHMRW